MSVQQLAGRGVDHFVRSVGTRLDGSPLGVMLDIDGTLAAIAPRPEDAAVSPATRDALRRLVELPGVAVAFISGRSAKDAQRMVDLDGTWIVGNHGLELRTPAGDLTAVAEARKYEPAVKEAVRMLAPMERSIPGAIVEDKRWSLSLHYRLVDPSAVATLKERGDEVAQATGLRVTEGKMLVELRPPIRIDKGTATVALAQRIGAVDDGASLLSAGDDRTDEDAFRALREHNSRAVTVRIMADADRVEPTHAEFVLASPDELRLVLDWLIARRTRA